MIIFYDPDSREIIGTIDGRVHFQHHLQMSIRNGNSKKPVKKLIIGEVWETNKEGKVTGKKQHNLHLWEHYLEFEDPRNAKQAVEHRIQFDKLGKPIGFEKK